MAKVLGIDIGGTGMKAAPVDTTTGELVADRHRILTPHPAVPDTMAGVFAQLTSHFDWTGPVGATFPAVVKAGVARTAANIDRSWIGTDVAATFARTSHCDVTVVNDADAAGVAEMEFGAGKGRTGVVMMITLGTGIGTALFVDGRMVPNTELGHLKLGKKEAEARAADSVRQRLGLSWAQWAKRLDDLPARARAALVPRPVHPRGWRQQAPRPVHPPADDARRGGAGRAAQRGRHRRRGDRRAAGRRHRRHDARPATRRRLAGDLSQFGGSLSGVRPAKPVSGQCHHSMRSSPSSQHSR